MCVCVQCTVCRLALGGQMHRTVLLHAWLVCAIADRKVIHSVVLINETQRHARLLGVTWLSSHRRGVTSQLRMVRRTKLLLLLCIWPRPAAALARGRRVSAQGEQPTGDSTESHGWGDHAWHKLDPGLKLLCKKASRRW